MYEFSVLARAAFNTRPDASGSAYADDPLDRPEWDGFLPVVTALARWKSIQRKRSLTQPNVTASPVPIGAVPAGVHPSGS